NEKWGSEAAAPIFSAIGREVLRYLEIPPRDVSPVQIVTAAPGAPSAPRVRLVSNEAPLPEAAAIPTMPDLRSRTLRHALGELEKLGVEVTVEGRGRVVRQEPDAGTPIEPGTAAHLTLAATGDTRR